MDLLVYLASAGSRVVSAEELLKDVWQGRVFDAGIVYKKVNQLRKALGDDPHCSRFIETIPKRGYRLVAPVLVLADRGDSSRIDGAELIFAAEVDSSPAPSTRRHELDTARASRSLQVISRPAARRNVYWFAGVLGLALVLPVVIYRHSASHAPSPEIIPLTIDGGMKSRPRLSPDGTMVAFTWNGQQRVSTDAYIDANADVYVKQIGRDTVPIRITDHAGFDGEATWSPDGQRLAFLRDESGGQANVYDGRLSIYVVPSTGGEATKIVDLESLPVYGAVLLGAVAWSPPDGRFLAYSEKPSPDAPAQIVRLDLDLEKKTPEKLSTPAPDADAIGDIEPVYSPEGDRIAFVRGRASASALDVWVMDSDGGHERQITSGKWTRVHSLCWLASDELLFTAGSTSQRSYSVRLDAGTPRLLPGLGEGDVSATFAAGRMVFVRREFKVLSMWQAPGRLAADRDAPPRDLAREGIKLVFSRMGDKIAWQSQVTGRPQIWIADSDGAHAHQLTDRSADAFNPQWSPDGESIAFHSGDTGKYDVYVADVRSRGVRALTSDEANDRYPTYSRNGLSIYFSSDRTGRSEIYQMPAAGGDAVQLTHDGGTFAIESDDGKDLYYEFLDTNNGYAGAGPVWRVPVNGSGPRKEALEGWKRYENFWVLSREGVYYLKPAPDFSIWYHDASGEPDRPVFQGKGAALYPGVSPDEKTVFFSYDTPRDGVAELWLVEGFR